MAAAGGGSTSASLEDAVKILSEMRKVAFHVAQSEGDKRRADKRYSELSAALRAMVPNLDLNEIIEFPQDDHTLLSYALELSLSTEAMFMLSHGASTDIVLLDCLGNPQPISAIYKAKLAFIAKWFP